MVSNIGFVGYALAGKDTAAKLMQLEFAKDANIFKTYAFAEPLKTFISEVFEIDPVYLHDQRLKPFIFKRFFDRSELENRFIRAFLDLYMKYHESVFEDGLEDDDIIVDASYYFEQMLESLKDYKAKRNRFFNLFFYNEIGFELSYRELMQLIGTEFFRNKVDPNFWTIIAPKEDTFFTDVRFPNEANHILNHDGILVKVNNLKQMNSSKMGHISESFIDSLDTQFVINNSGDDMEQFVEEVERVVSLIKEST